MKPLVHPDPVVLERELLRRIDSEHPGDGTGRSLVLVPASRLVAHVQRRLAELRPAWLGLEVLHFRALARRVLETAGVPVPAVIPSRLLEDLLRRLLPRRPDNLWSGFAERRPGTVRRLLSAMRELREAGIEPGELDSCAEAPPVGDLAELYRLYCASLERRAERGWADDDGMIRLALPHLARFARRYGAAFVYGAYELIGIHADLLRALDREVAVTLLLPVLPGSRVTRYAERYARSQLVQGAAAPERIPTEAEDHERETLLAALFDEAASPPPAAAGRFVFRHAQGAAAEAKIAVREALAAVRAGCAPREIVIAARSLAPYAAALEEAFEEEQVPWTSSLTGPLRRQPLVHDLLLMLRVVGDRFPRRATAELLASPRIRWSELLGGDEPIDGDRADRWSREAGIVDGLREWARDLPAWAGRARLHEDLTDEERAEEEQRADSRREAATRMGRALSALHERMRPSEDRSWPEHAGRVAECLDLLEVAEQDRAARSAREAVGELLDEMRALPLIAGAGGQVAFGEMLAWLEEAVDGSELGLHGEDEGGIRVLDAMQLRGLTCERIHLLGMNSGVFPRLASPDPVLSTPLRRRLRESTGRPLTLREEAIDEERLLLALVLGSARERVEVSWQRADETGKAKTPSLALRELARAVTGRPDAAALAAAAVHWPSHPEQWLESLRRNTGMLSPGEEKLLAALRAGGTLAGRLAEEFPDLAPGLKMLAATESYAPGDASFDAGVGSLLAPPESHSVSALETLGRCPLQYFFRYGLRVEELEEEASLLEIAPREMGIRVHRVLERLYGRLLEEELFDTAPPGEWPERALALLPDEWDRAMRSIRVRMEQRLPLLWERIEEEWIGALRSFVCEDLACMAAEGLRPISLEERVEREVDLGSSVRIHLHGRLDRRLAGEEGERVGDYKSSGRLKKRGDVTEMLKARTLQVPLYWLIAGESAGVELLGVGPDFDFEDPERLNRRLRFEGLTGAGHRDGFLEDLRVLHDLLQRGRFPLRPDEGACGYCPYAPACRRLHPPTLEREASDRVTRRYHALARKNKTRHPTLATILTGDAGEARA